jgi:hypothetical protein
MKWKIFNPRILNGRSTIWRYKTFLAERELRSRTFQEVFRNILESRLTQYSDSFANLQSRKFCTVGIEHV